MSKVAPKLPGEWCSNLSHDIVIDIISLLFSGLGLAFSFSTPLRWGVDMSLNVWSLLDMPPVMLCVVANIIVDRYVIFLRRATYSYGTNAVGIEPSIFCQSQFYNRNIIGLWRSFLVRRVGLK